MKEIIFTIGILIIFSQHSISQNLRWAKHLAGRGASDITNLHRGHSTITGMAVDDLNNIYITGISNDSVDFDPGPGENFIIGGDMDVFIAKYDASANLIWAHVFKSNGTNYAKDLVLDVHNNIYITGYCQSPADFDPGPGENILAAQPGHANYSFVAKYNTHGYLLWANSFSTKLGVLGFKLSIDLNNNVFATGTFYDTLYTNQGQQIISNGTGVYIVKFNSNGNFVWGKCISGVGNLGGASSINIDNNNFVIVAGYFGGTVDFDMGTGVFNMTAATSSNRFIAKYNNNGDFLWAKNINVNEDVVFYANRFIFLKIDTDNNVIITGNFRGTVVFDQNASNATLSTSGLYTSSFILKYSQYGDFLSVYGLNGPHHITDLELDCDNNIFITGFAGSNTDFDPGPGLVQHISQYNPNCFIAKYDQDFNYLWSFILKNHISSFAYSYVLKVKNGSQYIAGGLTRSVDFDPDTSEFILTSSGIGRNGFFVKYVPDFALVFNLDYNICPGEEILLEANVADANYLWSNGSGNNEITVTQPGNYWVNIEKQGECIYREVWNVKKGECETLLEMPNVFTPNSDGKNDIFIPIKYEYIKSASIRIYNRWGQLIYETDNLLNGWKGPSSNRISNDNNYFWIINYSDYEDNFYIKKGYVKVIN
jgi:gliding motility-associated-like protein